MSRRRRLVIDTAVFVAAIVVFFLLTVTAASAEWRFAKAHDGDTPVLVNDNGEKLKIRVRYVDTPEANQPGCAGAKKLTEELLQGHRVHVVGYKPSHDRLQATLKADNVDLGRRLVEEGWAWVDPRYAKDKSLFALQDKAMADRKGLWAKPFPIPPWEWRRRYGWNGRCAE